MHQIDGATAVAGHFVDGTTKVTADWLNTVQDELCNLITSQGIALNPSGGDDCKQVIAAISKLATSISGSTSVSISDFNAAVQSLNTAVGACVKTEDFNKILMPDGKTSLLIWAQAWIENVVGVKYPTMPSK